ALRGQSAQDGGHAVDHGQQLHLQAARDADGVGGGVRGRQAAAADQDLDRLRVVGVDRRRRLDGGRGRRRVPGAGRGGAGRGGGGRAVGAAQGEGGDLEAGGARVAPARPARGQAAHGRRVEGFRHGEG